MAGQHDFIIEKGAHFVRSLSLSDSNTGLAIDITGFTARMQVRRHLGAADPIISLVSPSDITVGGANGVFTVTIDDTFTAAMPAGEAVYDFEMVDTFGIVTRLLEGAVTIIPEVTR